jgi:hypothetical protein
MYSVFGNMCVAHCLLFLVHVALYGVTRESFYQNGSLITIKFYILYIRVARVGCPHRRPTSRMLNVAVAYMVLATVLNKIA